MSYQVLARKWRPRSFQDMVGQTHVLKALINALDTDRLHHAYLFTGTRGVGKTTLARILAKCLNCDTGVSSTPCGECSACVSIDEGRFVDLIEVDAASRAKVEETRDLMDNVQYAPSAGRYKVYLIDEVHMFSNHSFNALLKTLEEPPPHVKFLLATTEAKKIPITILSRCLQFNLKHLTSKQIEEQLAKILTAESIQFDAVAAHLIALAAKGSMRDALSILDQAIAYGQGELLEEQVSTMLGTLKQDQLFELLNDIIANDAVAAMAKLGSMAETTPDYDTVLAEMLSIFHQIAVAQVLPPETDTLSSVIKSYRDTVSPEDVQLFYQIAVNGRKDLYMAADPRMGFEMTIIRMLAFQPLQGAVSGATSGSPAQAETAATAATTATVADNRSSQTAAQSTQAANMLEGQSRQASTQPAIAMGGEGWRKIIDEMALSGLLKEFAGHCSLKTHDSEKVHLVLRPNQGHLLKTTQKDRLQEAIRLRFGGEMKLLITVEESAAETPAQARMRKAEEAKQAAIDAIEKDMDVQNLLKVFDGKVDKDATQLHKPAQEH